MLTAYMVDTEQSGDVDIVLADLEDLLTYYQKRFGAHMAL
jgi:hypothetical protein